MLDRQPTKDCHVALGIDAFAIECGERGIPIALFWLTAYEGFGIDAATDAVCENEAIPIVVLYRASERRAKL